MGEMVEFPSDGHTCTGYLAVPAGGAGPGVVVIQEWWGLVDHIKDVADRLASQGFTALATDLYHGRATTEPDEAAKEMMALEIPRAARDLSGSVQFLLDDARATGGAVGSVGFCMGGGLSLYLATLRPEVKADIVYYGVIPWPEAKPDLSRISGKVLGHFGEKDSSIPRERADRLLADLVAAGVDAEFYHYPDADHAFFNDGRPEVHKPDASQLSWDRTLAFLRRELAEQA